MEKYYAVWIGKKPGVYNSWDECKAQVDKFPNAKYKKLKATSYPEALIEFEADNLSVKKLPSTSTPTPTNNIFINKPTEKILTVDGAANGICCEYQAVWTSGEKAFHSPQYKSGTNNIAEFLGLVSAIQYLYNNNLPLKIYTDSVTAMAWLRDKSANTTARATGKITEELEILITQAEEYLKTNSNIMKNVEVLKWNTKEWGEIPADYGRK